MRCRGDILTINDRRPDHLDLYQKTKQTYIFEPRQRVHARPLAAGLASEPKIAFFILTVNLPAASRGEVQNERFLSKIAVTGPL